MNESLEPLLCGVLIGLGSLLTMAASGKVPGISGIVARILHWNAGDAAWRVVFLVGLIGGAALAFALNPGSSGFTVPGSRGLAVYAVAGLLVGFGSRVGGGCTSGHGVCGIGSGARDDIIYTIVFMATAALTVFVWNLTAQGATAG